MCVLKCNWWQNVCVLKCNWRQNVCVLKCNWWHNVCVLKCMHNLLWALSHERVKFEDSGFSGPWWTKTMTDTLTSKRRSPWYRRAQTWHRDDCTAATATDTWPGPGRASSALYTRTESQTMDKRCWSESRGLLVQRDAVLSPGARTLDRVSDHRCWPSVHTALCACIPTGWPGFVCPLLPSI